MDTPKGLIVKTFNSLSEQKDFIQPPIKENKWVAKEIKKEQPRDKNFYGNHNLQETLEGMDYGFQANTDYFLENLKLLNTDEVGENIVKMDVEGFAYDMGAVVAGEPECCVNMNTRGVGKTLTVNIDMNFAWFFTAKEINNRSIAIVKLLNTLISQGYILNVYIVTYNHQNNNCVYTKTKIDTNFLDVSTIAFVSSVEFFRQVVWITQDVLRNGKAEAGRGNGFYKNNEHKEFVKNDGFFIPGYYDLNKEKHISGDDLQKEYKTVETATKHIESLFNEYCEKEVA